MTLQKRKKIEFYFCISIFYSLFYFRLITYLLKKQLFQRHEQINTNPIELLSAFIWSIICKSSIKSCKLKLAKVIGYVAVFKYEIPASHTRTLNL